MGSYLSTPVREKCSVDYIGKISYGASSMQGWRASQEDAHNCQVNFDGDTETSLFAVYDGHGGAEVALYTAKNLPDFLKNLSSYKSGKLSEALEEAFVGFDATLTDSAIIKQLKDIAGLEPTDDDMEDDEVKDEAALLREEATIPIEKLIQKYKNGPNSILVQSNTAETIKVEKVESPINDVGEIGNEKLTNGSQEGSCVEDSKISAENDKDKKELEEDEENGEVIVKKSDKDSLPHCSKTAEQGDTDEEEEEDDDDDDGDDDDDDSDEQWNSDEADSDEEDDDAVDIENSFSITKLFQNEDEDGFSPIAFGETPGSDSGCTAVVALLRGNDLYVANAGDSRCVVCRGQTAIDMSVDHKPEDDIEKERIHKAGGKITADGRVNGGLNLSRAIGDHAYKRNKELELKDQMITSQPDIKHIELTEEDRFMVLACDGIWNVLSSQEVVDFVLKRIAEGDTKLSTICEELFETCLAPDTTGDGTGCDNMTCIVVMLPNNVREVQSSTFNAASSEVGSAAKRKRIEDGGGDDRLVKRCREDSESETS